MEQKKPRRRWLKFSLGGLLLAITALCLLLGWQADRVARQRRAVEMVERLGGTVYFVHQRMTNTPGWHDLQIATPGPRWLHNLVGEEWFRTPESVEIVDWGGRATGIDLETLRGLKSVKAFVLHKSPITDDDLRIVAQLRQLEELRLYGADVSDAGLKKLSSLRQLRSLTIGNRWVETAKISDQGLSYLVPLRRLAFLDLGKTCITADGLEQVAQLKDLQSLEIGLPGETEVRPACLEGLHKLTDLTLDGAYLSEGTCKSLAANKSLSSLSLTDCRVSDAALGSLVQLHQLSLQRTSVSGKSLKNLTTLRVLSLSQMEVDAELMDSLRELPQLVSLRIFDCSVDSGAMSRLAPLPQLEQLQLSNSSIRDDDLTWIEQLTGLTHLALDSTQITDAGLSRLEVSASATVYLDGVVSEAAVEQFGKRTGATVEFNPFETTTSSANPFQDLP